MPIQRPHRFPPLLLALLLLLGACTSQEEPTTTGAAATAGDGGDAAVDGNESGNDDGGGETAAVAGLDEREREHLVDDAATTWDVTLQDDMTVVDGGAYGGLINEDGGAYTFDAEAAEAAGLVLEEGRTLLLAGRAVRRITATSTAGGTTTVSTEPGTLADVIEDGTVAWDVPIGFGFDRFVTEASGDAVAAPAAPAASVNEQALAGGARPVLTSVSTLMPDGRVVPVAAPGDVAKGIWDSIEVDEQAGSVAWEYTVDATRYRLRLTSAGDTVEILVVVGRSQ